MTGSDKNRPQGGSQAQQQQRTERLRAALRENLRRRKAQARGRADGDNGPAEPRPDAVPEQPDRRQR